MFKHLRRWHFDVAIFLGLTLFVWAHWNSVPRPVWQRSVFDVKTQSPMQYEFIDWKSEQQTITCFGEYQDLETKQRKQFIDKRDPGTGELQKRLPLQFTNQEEGELDESHIYQPYVRIRWRKQSGECVHRFFSTEDGKPLGMPIKTGNQELLRLMTAEDHSQEALLLRLSFGNANTGKPTQVLSLTTGVVLKTFEPATKRANFAYLTPDGKQLLVFWIAGKGKYALEVFSTSTWEGTGHIKEVDGFLSNLVFLDNNTWLFEDYIKLDPKQNVMQRRWSCYHFDPAQKTLNEKPDHPLHGRVTKNPLLPMPPVLLESMTKQNEPLTSPILKTLEQWLARIGIQRDYTQKQSIFIRDLASNEILRSIHGLPVQGIQHSSDWLQLYTIRQDSRTQDFLLSAYDVPDHRWHLFLSWLQWLSWLLVIPWPLRYFVRKADMPRLAG